MSRKPTHERADDAQNDSVARSSRDLAQLEPLGPLYVADRFEPLHMQLVELLHGLQPADWQKPTTAGYWRVRDVAAHLLDVDLRKLSVQRDGYRLQPDRAIDSYPDLVAWLNEINAQWVESAQRLSPALLIQLLGVTGPLVAGVVSSLDPQARSLFPVAWAGEASSQNWMDTARDYTERWHHQQQIRDAVGAPPLYDHFWLHPVLDASVRALPHAYRAAEAPDGTTVVIAITGAAGDEWTLLRRPADWTLLHGAAAHPTTRVELNADDAWRLLFNALTPDDALARMHMTGDEHLVRPLVHARAVMV